MNALDQERFREGEGEGQNAIILFLEEDFLYSDELLPFWEHRLAELRRL